MEKITGIGGFYFRSNSPKDLSTWYETHLGISAVPDDEEEPSWQQQAGSTLFAPLPKKSSYFGGPDRHWAITFRVRDLDSMVAQLEKAGIDVEIDPEFYPNGRFASLTDPEGNPIELWQPDPEE